VNAGLQEDVPIISLSAGADALRHIDSPVANSKVIGMVKVHRQHLWNHRLEEQNRELRDRIGRLEKGAAASATPTTAK
jgi:hypothetical protein